MKEFTYKLGNFSIIFSILIFLIAIFLNIKFAIIILLVGVLTGILWLSISEILRYLKSINEKINMNTKLIREIRIQLDNDINVKTEDLNNENWKCNHCGMVNSSLDSRCKKCGFY